MIFYYLKIPFYMIFKDSENHGKFLTIKGATGNTLKTVTLKLPLGRMVSITGVSGSGKSSLVHDTLFPILNQYFKLRRRKI